MSILSPLTAVISAVIPVGVGLVEGERLGTPAVAGLLIAVLAIVLVGGGPSPESSQPRRLALSALANLAFLLAVRSGDLSIVAVITALYPGATVVLAWVVLGERLRSVQVAGLAAAALAVSLLALG